MHTCLCSFISFSIERKSHTHTHTQKPCCPKATPSIPRPVTGNWRCSEKVNKLLMWWCNSNFLHMSKNIWAFRSKAQHKNLHPKKKKKNVIYPQNHGTLKHQSSRRVPRRPPRGVWSSAHFAETVVGLWVGDDGLHSHDGLVDSCLELAQLLDVQEPEDTSRFVQSGV